MPLVVDSSVVIVYDMLYVALSIRENCRLLTADEKLVNAIGAARPNVAWIGSRV